MIKAKSIDQNGNGNLKGLEISDTEMISCVVCKGTGLFSRSEIITLFGGKNLLSLLKMNKEEVFSALNEHGPSFVSSTIEKGIEQHKERQKMEIEKFEEKAEKQQEEIADLRYQLKEEKKKVTQLETKQKSVPALIGQSGEEDFADWIGQYAQFECSEKLSKTGDYIVKVKKKLPNGNLEVISGGSVVVDCKRLKRLTQADIDKLFKDAGIRKTKFAYLLVDDKKQFRGEDKKDRIVEKNGVLLFKGDRNNFLDDLSFIEHFASYNEDQKDIENYRSQNKELIKVLQQSCDELEEFRKISASIIREADKIELAVDKKKRAINRELIRIAGGSK